MPGAGAGAQGRSPGQSLPVTHPDTRIPPAGSTTWADKEREGPHAHAREPIAARLWPAGGPAGMTFLCAHGRGRMRTELFARAQPHAHGEDRTRARGGGRGVYPRPVPVDDV